MREFKPSPAYTSISYRLCAVAKCQRIATTSIDVKYDDGTIVKQPVCHSCQEKLAFEAIKEA